MNAENTNAIAGPSNIRILSRPSSPATPHLFLPPPAPPQTSPAYLSSTQDLLARFNLLPAYDKYVRPFSATVDTALDQQISASTPVVNGGLDKGKGKEVVDTPDAAGLQDGGDGDDEDGGGKGDKKKKNNYKHLLKGIPGKHSFKKDDYLWTMMQIPPKQRMPIQTFDPKTQRDAFTVSLEGLKGWNPSALVVESPQAREDRKKRKELKRLQKLQGHTQTQALPAAAVVQPTPVQSHLVSSTIPASSLSRGPPITTSPATTVPRPGSTVPRPRSTIPMPGSTKSVLAAPGGVTTPTRPGSTGIVTPRTAGPITPVVPAANSYLADLDKRGTKREREEMAGATPVNVIGPVALNGNVATNQSKAILGARAGTAGVRPRPIKKQRMDMQGQARDVAMMQQPTPQGV